MDSMAKWPKDVGKCELKVQTPLTALAMGRTSWLSAMWQSYYLQITRYFTDDFIYTRREQHSKNSG